jgi:hypothetical protein
MASAVSVEVQAALEFLPRPGDRESCEGENAFSSLEDQSKK